MCGTPQHRNPLSCDPEILSELGGTLYSAKVLIIGTFLFQASQRLFEIILCNAGDAM